MFLSEIKLSRKKKVKHLYSGFFFVSLFFPPPTANKNAIME